MIYSRKLNSEPIGKPKAKKVPIWVDVLSLFYFPFLTNEEVDNEICKVWISSSSSGGVGGRA